MQQLTAKQLFKLLLLLSDLTPYQMAKELNTSKATIERWIRDNSTNTRKFASIAGTLGTPIYIQVGDRKHKIQDYNRYAPILHKRKGLTVQEAAKKVGIKGECGECLKARIGRNSCKLYNLQEHFKGLKEPLIIIINHNKYLIV